MSELTAMSISELQSAISRGDATRKEVVEAHLERVDAVNPLTNSFVELRSAEVLAEAAAADAQHGATIAGALDGVPISLKDSYAIVGLRRSDGLKFYEDRYPERDEVVVERLKRSGGLILGHSAVPDLCIRWNTISGLYGETRNPRDLSKSPGGSSGGDAANVAAGLATVGIGGDLGGSIRVPASFCGVFGFRPGFGRVPSVTDMQFAPFVPAIQQMATIGPLARTVSDIEASYVAMEGWHPYDPSTADVPSVRSQTKPRIAVFRAETGAVLDDEIVRRLDRTIEILRHEGYEVVEDVAPRWLSRAPEIWAELLATDMCQFTIPEMGEHVDASEKAHINDLYGAFELGNDHRAIQKLWIERHDLLTKMFAFLDEFPIVVAPVAGMPTPPLHYDHFIGREASLELFDRMRSTPWVNVFNLPSLALPNGIQLVGRRWHELDVLDVGYDVERHLDSVAIATPTAGT